MLLLLLLRPALGLECLQCARVPGWPTRCPADGVLESLDDWTACMTWTLDNGTVVLSNFVMEDEECSADRLAYWGREYLPLVWNSTGRADCCTEDGCNDAREPSATSTASADYSTTLQTEEQGETTVAEEGRGEELVDCTECDAVEHSECLGSWRRATFLESVGGI
jgi:hypothetical protein